VGGADRETGSPVVAPGAMGTFGGDRWRADALVRYDAATARELFLMGMNEATDATVPATNPVRKTWYALPTAPVTGAVAVWVEDAAGDATDALGNPWRRLKAAEYSVDGVSGILFLVTPPSGNLAIAYDGVRSGLETFASETRDWFSAIDLPDGAFETTFLANGTDYAASFETAIDGTNAVLLAEKGRFSPFEILSRYAISGDAVELAHGESDVVEDEFFAGPFDDGYAEIGASSLETALGVRDPAARYPLAKRLPLTYLPPFSPGTNATDLVVRSRTFTPVSEISLGDKAIPGTIVMTRNGIEDAAFTFNPDSGILKPDRLPGITDSIRITWLDADPAARNSAFTAAVGGAAYPINGLSLSAASALRWNLSETGYSDASESSPGTWISSAGVAWEREGFRVSTAVAFTVVVPDTTGLYRVAGMDSDSAVLVPGRDWYREIPESAGVTLGSPALGTEIPLSPSDNVASVSSETLDGVSGSALRLEATLEAASDWAGADILTGELGSADLRNASSIELTLRNPGSSDAFTLYLQAGAADTGFSEASGAVATWVLPVPAAGAGWVTTTVSVTAEARRRMGGWQNLRLLAVPSGSTAFPSDIAIESGPISYRDGGFVGSIDIALALGGSGGFCEAETETSGTAVQALDAHSGDIVNRLNPGGNNGILAIRLKPDDDGTGLAVDETLSASRYLPAVPLNTYQAMAFELHPGGLAAWAPGATLSVALMAPTVTGSPEVALRVDIPVGSAALPADRWRTVRVDLSSRTVTADGTSLTGASAYYNPRAESPTLLIVSLSGFAGADATVVETLRLDELRLLDTEPYRSVTNETALAWSREGRVAGIGGLSLVADPKVSVEGRTTRNLETDAATVSGTASAGATLAGVRLAGSAVASSERDNIIENASHDVSVPLGMLDLAESLSADYAETRLSRSDALRLGGPLPVVAQGTVSMTSRLLAREDTLSVNPTIPLGPAGSLALTLNGRASQNGDSPRSTLDGADWGSLWTDSLWLMASLGEADARQRGVYGGLNAAWRGTKADREWGLKSVGAGLDLTETYSVSPASAASRVSVSGYSLSLPLSVAATSLTPTWKRSVTRRRAVGAGGTWDSDARALGDSLSKSAWLRESLPIADLFGEAPPGNGDSQSAFTFLTEYSLGWDRAAPGSLSDLWVPVSVDASIARETLVETRAASSRDTRNASARASFSALNLAGAYGIRPVFKWYDQDEVSQSYGWTCEWGAGYYLWTVDAWDGLSLYYGDTGSFSLDNAVSYTSPGIDGTGETLKGSVRVAWRRPAPNSPLAPLFARFTDLPMGAKREDSLTWSWRTLETAATSADYAHALVTTVGQNGEIKISGGVSYQSASNQVSTLGIRLSLGGTLTY